jgi:hypothetical protein
MHALHYLSPAGIARARYVILRPLCAAPAYKDLEMGAARSTLSLAYYIHTHTGAQREKVLLLEHYVVDEHILPRIVIFRHVFQPFNLFSSHHQHVCGGARGFSHSVRKGLARREICVAIFTPRMWLAYFSIQQFYDGKEGAY